MILILCTSNCAPLWVQLCLLTIMHNRLLCGEWFLDFPSEFCNLHDTCHHQRALTQKMTNDFQKLLLMASYNHSQSGTFNDEVAISFLVMQLFSNHKRKFLSMCSSMFHMASIFFQMSLDHVLWSNAHFLMDFKLQSPNEQLNKNFAKNIINSS